MLKSDGGARRLFTPWQWITLIAGAALVIVVVPVLNAGGVKMGGDPVVPDISLFGKYLTYAILALGMDLLWGYTGILSLGQGVFFALGGYCLGMNLMLNIGLEGKYNNPLPDFLVFLQWDRLPFYWPPFRSLPFAVFAVVMVPTLFAAGFGFLAFRSRIRGVYFSIITQALTFALMLLFFMNAFAAGGNNGFTDFKSIAGYRLAAGPEGIGSPAEVQSTMRGLYVVSGVVLLAVFLLCRWITRSRLGHVLEAIRDGENRVRFSGYSPVGFKLFVFIVAGAISGIAGALYVPQAGIINPELFKPDFSIEVAIWVAVGGRGTLVGAVLGAILVNALKSWMTRAHPDIWILKKLGLEQVQNYWLFLLGAIFVLVVMVIPDGLVSVPRRLRALWVRFRKAEPAEPAAAAAPATGGPPVAATKEQEPGA
jgi:urea transport system permease protein